jgi:hypothetical protein
VQACFTDNNNLKSLRFLLRKSPHEHEELPIHSLTNEVFLNQLIKKMAENF